jgi:DNA-binding NarL/FixJ family response regulator
MSPESLLEAARDLEKTAADLRHRAAILTERQRIQTLARETALARSAEIEVSARNIEIMRLASHGWNNHQIGDRFGLHPGSVSRIIRKMLRR